MGILEEWLLQIILLVVIFLASSLLYENYRKSEKRPQDLCLILSFGIIILKQAVVLVALSGRVFFKLTGFSQSSGFSPPFRVRTGFNFWFPVVDNSLEALFYLFMAYTMYLSYVNPALPSRGWVNTKTEIKKTLSVTTVSLIIFTGLMLYYWRPYAYNKITFGRFWGDPFFEILYLGLIGVIIIYLYLQKKGLFKGWIQGAFYLMLAAHILHIINLIKSQGEIIALKRTEEIFMFLGYLTLAFSQIKLKIQPKLVLILILVLLLPAILTTLMVSNEIKNKLMVFTYEKISKEGVLNTVFDLKKVLYLIAGLGVLLAGFIGYMFSARITNPLAKLVQGARKVGRGDFSNRIEIQTKDELRELADEFNQMTTSLKENTNKLERTNERLKIVNEELIEKGQELVQAAKMASIGQLAGGVAHEINNPLMSMMGWAQLGQEIIEKKEGKVSREEKEYLRTLKKYLNIIEDGTRRCQVVTEGLLKISRQTDLSEIKLMGINQAIEDAFTAMQYQTKFKNIEIKKSFSSSLPRVNINQTQIQQVFFDLISNAALAMPQGGELYITTSCINGKFIEVKVTDTGHGISRENLDKVFNPFFSTRGTGKGMGLGLSVAYGIIKQHNGTIEVESKEKVGTTFTIRLPVA